MSMRNGPNGEFQLTPKPIETRGLGVSPRKVSWNGAVRAPALSVVPVGRPTARGSSVRDHAVGVAAQAASRQRAARR